MAADLSIHVRTEPLTDDVMRAFFANTLGSSWGPKDLSSILSGPNNHDSWMEAVKVVSDSPQVWIGEVSWLKAALAGDDETFVPNPVAQISELIGDDGSAELTDDMIEAIIKAIDVPNQTGYSVATPEQVRPFLEEHRGKPVFCVSW